jgi:hypothetical protein
MKRTTLILSIFMMLGISTLAQEPTPKADVRQKNQRARIHEGRANGDLTHKESAQLKKQQRHIRRTEKRAKADVTTLERRKLDRKQDRANRHIQRAKNNEVSKAN